MLQKQKSGSSFFSSFGRPDSRSVFHGISPERDFSRTSTNTNYSTNTESQRKIRSSNSFSAAARGVAGALVTCFVPRSGSVKEDDPKHYAAQGSDNSSNSVSRLSTTSSRGQLRYKHNIYEDEESTKFTMADIYRATGNFAQENKIGEGGFGIVYKGKLKNGTLIAVKRGKRNKYDMHLSVEFKAEIEILSKIEHLNLVKLLGYLDNEGERIVVVEYVGNGNLREHLDGTRGTVLEIAERLDVAVDVAHAIAYMHMYADHLIIHRDIKATNILLTETLRAKVADFGFARLAASDPDATHVSTQIKGTAGYLDPEYVHTYQLTEKSDVYSFGVLLIELISGRRPIERSCDRKERLTTRWALHKYKEGETVVVMDPLLRRSPASIEVVERIMGLAAECLSKSRKTRPSMKKCAEVLWAIRRDFRHAQLGGPTTKPLTQQRSPRKLSSCNEIVEEEEKE